MDEGRQRLTKQAAILDGHAFVQFGQHAQRVAAWLGAVQGAAAGLDTSTRYLLRCPPPLLATQQQLHGPSVAAGPIHATAAQVNVCRAFMAVPHAAFSTHGLHQTQTCCARKDQICMEFNYVQHAACTISNPVQVRGPSPLIAHLERLQAPIRTWLLAYASAQVMGSWANVYTCAVHCAPAHTHAVAATHTAISAS